MALRKFRNLAEKPPRHLLKGGKQLWVDIAGDYDLEAYQIEILRLLCECLDRLELCRKQLKKDGMFSVNRFGETKQHCALKEEREHRVLFARLARELNLDLELPESPRKPRRY
jgi:phage terminase small subunit